MKEMLVSLTDSPAFSWFVGLMERLDREQPNLLRVLTYHRVDGPVSKPNLSPTLLSATPEDFARQMDFLKANYTFISPEQLLEYFDEKTGLPPRAVLVTFDDAYCDFAENAWPILRARDIPVILFVPTGFPDQPDFHLWWDALYNALRNTDHQQIDTPTGSLSLASEVSRKQAFRRLRDHVKSLSHENAMEWVVSFCRKLEVPPLEHNSILGWDALRALAEQGVALGAHTRTHPLMNRISIEQAHEEVVQSRRDLEREIGEVLPIFAYPSGGFSDDVVQVLEDEGFKLAFTTVRGVNRLSTTHPLKMRRINVGGRTTIGMLRAQLLPSLSKLQ